MAKKRASRKAPAKKKTPARKASAAKKKVSFIPRGYHTVTAYLACADAARALEFYKEAFGAVELMRFPAPGGRIGHAEMRIGDSRIMLADEYPDLGFLSPQARGGSPVHLSLYVRDVDSVVQRAVEAGAKVLREVKDQFYGDRSGTLEDPFGHVWHIATHKEDLSKAQLRKRAEQAMQQSAEPQPQAEGSQP